MRIVSAAPLPHYRLQVTFSDGSQGPIDLADIAGRGVFKAWQEPGIFEAVSVNEVGAVVWPGDLDLCPDAMYLRLTGKSVEEVFPAVNALSEHA